MKEKIKYLIWITIFIIGNNVSHHFNGFESMVGSSLAILMAVQFVKLFDEWEEK